jgi:UDP-glucose 4-epimerase
VPPPAVTITGDLLRRAKLVDVSPEQIRFLEHGRVADVSRLPIVFGYQPKYTTLQAFDDWVASAGLRLIDPEAVAIAERTAFGLLRRGHARLERVTARV